MQIQGTVTKIGDIQKFGNGFQKREIVVTTEEQYPQPLSIELLKDKVDLVNRLKVGDKVSVSINLRGREWTNPKGETKYFNSIVGWKIEANSSVPSMQQLGQPANYSTEAQEDDLPF